MRASRNVHVATAMAGQFRKVLSRPSWIASELARLFGDGRTVANAGHAIGQTLSVDQAASSGIVSGSKWAAGNAHSSTIRARIVSSRMPGLFSLTVRIA